MIKGAVPIVSGVSGFMGYYVVYAPDDTVTAISIFNKVEEAQESNRRALAWIEKHLAPYVVGQATRDRRAGDRPFAAVSSAPLLLLRQKVDDHRCRRRRVFLHDPVA